VCRLVGGVARGINIPNAQPDQAGFASVNPIFTWVRLAQRVPVRIHIDHVPDGVRLVAGMTATVQIERNLKHRSVDADSRSIEFAIGTTVRTFQSLDLAGPQ
jgi:multidrug resistance efflux pump